MAPSFSTLLLGPLLFAKSTMGVVYPLRKFKIGLWGDMPYIKNGDTPAQIAAIVASMNAEPKLAFTVFDGDIKDGSSACSEATFDTAIATFESSNWPVIYTPGDNEWTDCHRGLADPAAADAAPLYYLQYLRDHMFFSPPTSFGQKKLRLESQGEYPSGSGVFYVENVRWVKNTVYFMTLNMPGSNNNNAVNTGETTTMVNGATLWCTSKSTRTQAACDAAVAEYTARDAANIDFLRETFGLATTAGAPGLMIVIQANPGFDSLLTDIVESNIGVTDGSNGYSNFLKVLFEEINKFAGQVVLVHGDDHLFSIDKPFPSDAFNAKVKDKESLPKFTRVLTFGSPNLHWIRCTVDPTAQQGGIFTFEPVLVAANL